MYEEIVKVTCCLNFPIGGCMGVSTVHFVWIEYTLFLSPAKRSGSEEEVCVPHGFGLALMGLAPAECLTHYLLRRPHYRALPESTSLEAKAEPDASVDQKGPESQQFLGAV